MRSSVVSVCLIVCATVASACSNAAELQALVDRGGTRAEVENLLGPGCILYERGREHWTTIESGNVFQKDLEARNRFRAAAAKYPRVLYHTTAFVMTWVFLDEKDIAREFYLLSQ